jgi:hypothetical protein
MFAIPGPSTGPEEDIGGFPQTGTRLARVHGLQGEEPVRQPQMATPHRSPRSKAADGGDLEINAVVVREIETQCHRSRCHSTLDHVQPDEFTAPID